MGGEGREKWPTGYVENESMMDAGKFVEVEFDISENKRGIAWESDDGNNSVWLWKVSH